MRAAPSRNHLPPLMASQALQGFLYAAALLTQPSEDTRHAGRAVRAAFDHGWSAKKRKQGDEAGQAARLLDRHGKVVQRRLSEHVKDACGTAAAEGEDSGVPLLLAASHSLAGHASVMLRNTCACCPVCGHDGGEGDGGEAHAARGADEEQDAAAAAEEEGEAGGAEPPRRQAGPAPPRARQAGGAWSSAGRTHRPRVLTLAAGPQQGRLVRCAEVLCIRRQADPGARVL